MRFLERVLPANRVLLAGKRSGLAQAGTAAPFGPGGDTGTPLFVGQGVAVRSGGGPEMGSGAQLGGCARVVGTDVKPANLFAVAHEPNPIAAVTAFDGAIKTFP